VSPTVEVTTGYQWLSCVLLGDVIGL